MMDFSAGIADEESEGGGEDGGGVLCVSIELDMMGAQ
jgi:hypothetical protein